MCIFSTEKWPANRLSVIFIGFGSKTSEIKVPNAGGMLRLFREFPLNKFPNRACIVKKNRIKKWQELQKIGHDIKFC